MPTSYVHTSRLPLNPLLHQPHTYYMFVCSHHQTPGLWMARREELGHPLGTVLPPPPPVAPKPVLSTLPTSPATFVLEIGTEELPPDDVASGIEQLRCEWYGCGVWHV